MTTTDDDTIRAYIGAAVDYVHHLPCDGCDQTPSTLRYYVGEDDGTEHPVYLCDTCQAAEDQAWDDRV
jgi:hypothetical protein